MSDGAGRTTLKRDRRAARVPGVAVLPALWRHFRSAVVAAYRDNAFGNAKGAAYSSLLAFFPLLATATTILVRTQAQFISDAIYNFLSEILPPGTQDLVFYYFAVRGKQPVFVPITGMLISVWAGSGVMVSLMQGFHIAYRVPSGRPFVRERLIAIALVFSAAIPVLFASALIFFGVRAEDWIVGWLGLAPEGEALRGWVPLVGKMLRYAISIVAIVLGATILFYIGPNRPQRWRRVWPGAVLATMLGVAATSVFAWYVRHIANYNVMYGGIATVVLLLIWMYVLSVIAFIGCEFNAEIEKAREPR
jgi:membrane protein